MKKLTESKFTKIKLIPDLKRRGYEVFKISQRFSAGFPDLIAVKGDKSSWPIKNNGRVVFIEVKVDDNKLTKLQEHTMDKLENKGATCRVVWYINKTGDWWVCIPSNGTWVRYEADTW